MLVPSGNLSDEVDEVRNIVIMPDYMLDLCTFRIDVEVSLNVYKSGWWFQTFFILTPIWGRFPI